MIFHNTYRVFRKEGIDKKLKGELKRRNKLISFERPFRILENEAKTIKIRRATLQIFNFKDQDLDSFPRKNDRIPKMLFFRSSVQTEKQ